MSNFSRVTLFAGQSPISDTGTGLNGSDTGPHVFGELVQMRWMPSDGDSGGDLVLTALIDTSDTGQGWDFYNDNDCMGAQFTRYPANQIHHEDGRDTGATTEVPIVFSGERIRAKIVAGQAEAAGKLYLWFKQ